MWVTKLLISPVIKRIFFSKTTKFSRKLTFLTIAGSFGALWMGWLVVEARGLYLARHLFTLSLIKGRIEDVPTLKEAPKPKQEEWHKEVRGEVFQSDRHHGVPGPKWDAPNKGIWCLTRRTNILTC